jgi:glycosyltransferase involved in cell wall biosynthesis
MKVLLINKFLFPKGGDAISTINTGKLLSSKKHKVFFWGMSHPLNPKYPNRDNFVSYVDYDDPGSFYSRIKIALNLIYSWEARKKLEKVISIEKPDIVHLNNFTHQISPSILHALKKSGIPSVMTMHDFKLVCPAYTMMLDGKPCERCKNGKYYQCFVNKCVKGSKTKSILNTIEMYLHHKVLHIFSIINLFISPSKFLKKKIEEMGFNEKVIYLPNFININEFVPNYSNDDNSIIYVGRLSREKGLFTLLDAIEGIRNIKLKIIGTGPLRKDLESTVGNWRGGINDNVQFLGHKTGDALKNEIRKSLFLVLPSECYENNPLSIIEGYALGKPVIGSRIGGIPELIKDEETGLCFEPGNSDELHSKIEYLLNNPEKIIRMGRNARAYVEKDLNDERHYQKLMEIYNQAVCLK